MKKALLSKVAGSLLLSAGLLASTGASADTTLSFDAAGNAVFGMTHATPGTDFEDVYLFVPVLGRCSNHGLGQRHRRGR
jgi:hypothetical protein